MTRLGKPCPHTVPVAALYIEPDGRMLRKKKTGRNRLNDIPSPAEQTGHGRRRERSVHAGREGRHVALPRLGDQTVPFVQTARLAEAFATDIVPARTVFGRSGRRPRMPQRGKEEARPYDICEQTLHFRFGRSVPVRCKYNAFCETIRIPAARTQKNEVPALRPVVLRPRYGKRSGPKRSPPGPTHRSRRTEPAASPAGPGQPEPRTGPPDTAPRRAAFSVPAWRNGAAAATKPSAERIVCPRRHSPPETPPPANVFRHEPHRKTVSATTGHRYDETGRPDDLPPRRPVQPRPRVCRNRNNDRPSGTAPSPRTRRLVAVPAVPARSGTLNETSGEPLRQRRRTALRSTRRIVLWGRRLLRDRTTKRSETAAGTARFR